MRDQQTQLASIITRLRDKGHRLTPQRMAIINTLITNDEHPSVDQIYEQVKQEFPMTSLATVYKTIAMLKSIGEVMELDLNDHRAHYDGKKPYSHPHLICIRCKKIIDTEISGMAELSNNIAQTYGYLIVNQRLDFFGICPECQELELQNKETPQPQGANDVKQKIIG
jgi:Fur family peroxide stress response transcriptional regulator